MSSRKGIKPPPDWTPAEDAKLLALRQQGRTWPQITAELPGRTIGACTARAYVLGERGSSGVGKQRSSYAVPWHERQAAVARAIAARDAAACAPRSLTAAVFGDPLPGRSALDRRGETGRKITLAGTAP